MSRFKEFLSEEANNDYILISGLNADDVRPFVKKYFGFVADGTLAAPDYKNIQSWKIYKDIYNKMVVGVWKMEDKILRLSTFQLHRVDFDFSPETYKKIVTDNPSLKVSWPNNPDAKNPDYYDKPHEFHPKYQGGDE